MGKTRGSWGWRTFPAEEGCCRPKTERSSGSQTYGSVLFLKRPSRRAPIWIQKKTCLLLRLEERRLEPDSAILIWMITWNWFNTEVLELRSPSSTTCMMIPTNLFEHQPLELLPTLISYRLRLGWMWKTLMQFDNFHSYFCNFFFFNLITHHLIEMIFLPKNRTNSQLTLSSTHTRRPVGRLCRRPAVEEARLDIRIRYEKLKRALWSAPPYS